MKNIIVVPLVALALSACSLGPEKKDAAATYDLGAPQGAAASQPRIKASVLVHAVAAPSWLESNFIVYRLHYHDGARQLTYANSRWAAPAAALLTQRLRAQLAAASDSGILGIADGASADYALRIELEEFSQVFDTTAASRAVVVARASLVNVAKRTLQAQKTFTVEKPAMSANAEGGVRALAGASGELIDAIVAWSAVNAVPVKK